MNNQAINGNNQAINIWDNPANYKKCVKKQYEIWVCQPPQGTVVINKLEQADSVSACRGRTVFAPFEIEHNPQIKALCEQLVKDGKAYIVNNPQTFVLSGTRGELWCIKGDKLAKKYVWASDNTPINAQTLKSRLGDAKYLGWQKVRTIPDNSAAYACFVPAKIQGQIQTSWAILNINGRGVPHGKGDFVISQPGADGKPSADRYVVNGAVFADTIVPQQQTGGKHLACNGGCCGSGQTPFKQENEHRIQYDVYNRAAGGYQHGKAGTPLVADEKHHSAAQHVEAGAKEDDAQIFQRCGHNLILHADEQRHVSGAQKAAGGRHGGKGDMLVPKCVTDKKGVAFIDDRRDHFHSRLLLSKNRLRAQRPI